MRLEGISLYLEKTLIIGVGDVVKDCVISGVHELDALVSIPKETVGSGDWEVTGNTIEIKSHKPRREYDFVYRNYERRHGK